MSGKLQGLAVIGCVYVSPPRPHGRRGHREALSQGRHGIEAPSPVLRVQNGFTLDN